jgi:cell division protein FtsW
LEKNIIICLIGFGAITVLAFVRPYVMERIKTFINPSSDPRGSSYQLQQSLIAIGSGGAFGRGLGQSVQKFNYLPEPQGDSIFAVIGEEFGFLGTTLLLTLYVFFAIRGFKIALRAPDTFSRYLVVGLVTLLTAQSFLNIASLVGLFPLTGVPLVFISHGGTALMVALGAVGIILNVSRYTKKTVV